MIFLPFSSLVFVSQSHSATPKRPNHFQARNKLPLPVQKAGTETGKNEESTLKLGF